MAEYFNRLLSKTNQIFDFSPKIAVNSHIAGEDNLVGDLEPYRRLLLTSSWIDCTQIQIQPIEYGVTVGRLAFFCHFPVQLLDQQHGRPPGPHGPRPTFLSGRPG